MLASAASAAVRGVESYLVRVEVNLAPGLPSLAVVGLPEGAVREGRERVTAALSNAGHPLPLRRITVNLAPAQRGKRLRPADRARAAGGGGRREPAPLRRLDVRRRARFGRAAAVRPRHDADRRGLPPSGAARAGGTRRECRRSRCGRRPGGHRRTHVLRSAPSPGRRTLPAARPGGHQRVDRGCGLAPRWARPRRRPETGCGSARARGRRGRRSQSAARRASGIGEDDARQAAGGDQGPLGGRSATAGQRAAHAPAVPRSPPHGERRRTGRRWHPRAAGRGEPRPSRRALSRRAARIPASRPGGAAPADGGGRGGDRPRGRARSLSGALRPGGRHEPLELRTPSGAVGGEGE